MAENPKITVLVSVYNAAPFVRQSLTSLVEQSFRDFELIVIDDGSTDGSRAILEEFEARDSRIVLVRQERLGLTRSLNKGLRMARGEWIARHDADDVALPRRLEAQARFLEAHPEHVVVGCCYDKIDEKGRVLRSVRTRSSDFRLRLRLLDENAIPHPGAMFRRAVAEQLDGYDESLETAQDYDLWCRLATRGKLANLPEVLLQRRVHAEQVGARKKGDQLASRDAIRDRYRRQVAASEGVGVKGWYLRWQARRKLARAGAVG